MKYQADKTMSKMAWANQGILVNRRLRISKRYGKDLFALSLGFCLTATTKQSKIAVYYM